MQVFSAQGTSDYQLSDFERAVEQVDSIETMPVVAQRLIQLMSDPDYSMNKVHGLVQSDPAIAATIMRVASSPVYGAHAPSNLLDALVRIGTADLRKTVIASAMIGKKTTRFTEALWIYSLKVASVTDRLAQEVGLHRFDDPFLCGLLHDFGTVMLNKIIGKLYRRLLQEPCLENQRSLEVAEYGFDHCDLGVMIAQQWMLFDSLEHVMQHHHRPFAVDRLELPESSSLSVFAVALARQVVLSPTEESEELIANLSTRLGLSQEKLVACGNQGLERYRQMYSSLLSKRT